MALLFTFLLYYEFKDKLNIINVVNISLKEKRESIDNKSTEVYTPRQQKFGKFPLKSDHDLIFNGTG